MVAAVKLHGYDDMYLYAARSAATGAWVAQLRATQESATIRQSRSARAHRLCLDVRCHRADRVFVRAAWII